MYAFPVFEPNEMAEATPAVHGGDGELERLVPMPPRALFILHNGDDVRVELERVGSSPVELSVTTVTTTSAASPG